MLTELLYLLAVAIGLLVPVVCLMVLRDRSDAAACVGPTIPSTFRRMSLWQKIHMVNGKLLELQNSKLTPCGVKLAVFIDRVVQLQVYQNKEDLFLQDAMLQCIRAVEWLEESEEFKTKYVYYVYM